MNTEAEERAIEVMARAIYEATPHNKPWSLVRHEPKHLKRARAAYEAYQRHVQETMESVVMDSEGSVIDGDKTRRN